MKRILSRSHPNRLVVTMIVIGGLMLFYEATTFDLLPWGSISAALNPSAPAPGAHLDFTATAYCKGKTTASGAEVRTGIAAADAAILPVGSVINIATDNHRYNGVYTIMDTGPRVQGRVLDLYMWNCNEALAFGRKPVQVTVLRLGWNPQASTPGLIDRLFRRRERAKADAPPPEDPPPAAVEEPVDDGTTTGAESTSFSGSTIDSASVPIDSAPVP